jgi:hypothetical protein
VVEASCENKYYGSNFISAVPTSLLIAPGLRTIQFLFLLLPNFRKRQERERENEDIIRVIVEMFLNLRLPLQCQINKIDQQDFFFIFQIIL